MKEFFFRFIIFALKNIVIGPYTVKVVTRPYDNPYNFPDREITLKTFKTREEAENFIKIRSEQKQDICDVGKPWIEC